MENWRFMMYSIKKLIVMAFILPFSTFAQQKTVLSLDTVLYKIDKNNILLQSYGLRAESYKQVAQASTAWMAPMVGFGTFMTPYPGQMIMNGGDKGSLMLQIEQDIPNPVKQQANKRYIE